MCRLGGKLKSCRNDGKYVALLKVTVQVTGGGAIPTHWVGNVDLTGYFLSPSCPNATRSHSEEELDTSTRDSRNSQAIALYYLECHSLTND